jgi:hypothetical protein
MGRLPVIPDRRDDDDAQTDVERDLGGQPIASPERSSGSQRCFCSPFPSVATASATPSLMNAVPGEPGRDAGELLVEKTARYQVEREPAVALAEPAAADAVRCQPSQDA